MEKRDPFEKVKKQQSVDMEKEAQGPLRTLLRNIKKSYGRIIGTTPYEQTLVEKTISKSKIPGFGTLVKEKFTGKPGLTNADLIRISLPPLGIAGAAIGSQEISEKLEAAHKSKQSLESLMQDPELGKEDLDRASGLFNTLQEYAPSIAKDPLVSQAFVKGMLQYGHIDHKVVTDLMTSERIYRELKGKPFTALQAIKNVSWIA